MLANLAVTDFAALMRTVHVSPDAVSQPVQPVTSRLGLAVSVTTVSMTYDAEQFAPQLMPDGFELTLPRPAPSPALLTVSVKRFRSKIAVTVRAAFIATVHVVAVAESQPSHPAIVEFDAGVAVSVTEVPTSKSAEQFVPQVIVPGEELTLPEPLPARATPSSARCGTVIVVVGFVPELS